MPDRRRHLYELELPDFVSQSVVCRFDRRQPGLSDLKALADLMLNAYQGTIDYDGEDLHDARTEVESYLSVNPLLVYSVVVCDANLLLSACLVSKLNGDHSPLIAYIMTRKDSKRRGLARYALNESLTRLKADGYKKAFATITDDNTASERLFGSMGFVRVE